MNSAAKRKDRQPRPAIERRAELEASCLRLVVKRDGGVNLLPVHEIDSLEADGNVVVVRAAGDTYKIRVPLSQLLERLTGFGFIRIHRSTVVRLASIVGIEKGAYRKAFALLRNGARLEIGRAEFNRLRALWQPGLLDLGELSATLTLVPVEPITA
jgi:DNA-binding LytR/AlgR family response regulator